MQPIDWNQLAQSIADGEAVLVLGPDAIPFYRTNNAALNQVATAHEESTFSRLSHRRILELLSGQISHFYRRDNLFQFRDAPAKKQAMKCVRDTVRDTTWLPDSELLRQIVAIPFPVVLSLNPDKYVYQAFTERFREPQFDYFTTKDKPFQYPLEYPDGFNKPLVFNLCGSVEDKLDSVVLDYYDLFELLKNLLSDTGVSEHLTRKLREADRYVLLGFELDRWYFQLMLHYFNRLTPDPFNNDKQNFPILSKVSGATREFVMKQFNVQHIAASRLDFEELYQACERMGILRQLHDSRSIVETQVRMLTVQNKYEEVFQLLEQQLGAAAQSLDLPLLRARYTAWLHQKTHGTADTRDLELEINRIRYTLLTYANQIALQP